MAKEDDKENKNENAAATPGAEKASPAEEVSVDTLTDDEQKQALAQAAKQKAYNSDLNKRMNAAKAEIDEVCKKHNVQLHTNTAEINNYFQQLAAGIQQAPQALQTISVMLIDATPKEQPAQPGQQG